MNESQMTTAGTPWCWIRRRAIRQAMAGELGGAAELKLTAHLRGCAACQQRYDRASLITRALGGRSLASATFLQKDRALARLSHAAAAGADVGDAAPAGARAALPPRRRLHPMLAAAAGAALALFAVWSIPRVRFVTSRPIDSRSPGAPALPAGPVVTAVNFEAHILDAHGVSRSAIAGAVVGPADVLETRALGGRIQLAYKDGTRAWFTGHAWEPSRARGFSEIAGKQAFVESGILSADVVPQPRGQPMVVRTPHAVVTVVGTRFSIVEFPQGTRVEVEHGRVRVLPLTVPMSEAATLEVGTGEYVEAIAGEPLAIRPLVATPHVTGFSLLDARTGRVVPGFDAIASGARIDLDALPELVSLRANTLPALVPAVRFQSDDASLGRERLEQHYPFTLPGGPAAPGAIPGVVFLPWRPAEGVVNVSAVVCLKSDGDVCPGPSQRIELHFVRGRL